MRRHEMERNFHAKCSYCDKVYMTVRYWRKHVMTHEVAPVTETAGNIIGRAENTAYIPDDSVDTEDAAAVGAAEHGEQSFSPQKELASLIVRLRAKNVTQSSCHDVVTSMKRFCEEAVRQSQAAVNPSGEVVTVPVIKACEVYEKSAHLQSLATADCEMTKPTTIVLGSDANGKLETCEYVSVIAQLQKECDLKDMKGPSSEEANDSPSGLLSDISDGSAHKKHGPKKLLLLVYYDGFTIDNPLGNKVKRHNLGAIYYTIAGARSTSKLHDIFLAVLFQESHIEKYSWANVLRPFLDDLKHWKRKALK